MALESVNPTTDEVLETFAETSPREVDTILEGMAAAFRAWRGRSGCAPSIDLAPLSRLREVDSNYLIFHFTSLASLNGLDRPEPWRLQRGTGNVADENIT